MQTNTANKLSACRIKKRYFLGALFMAGLSCSAVIMPHTVAQYISMDDFCLEPYAGKDRIIRTTVRLKKDFQYDLSFSVTSNTEDGKKRDFYNFEKDFPFLYGRTYYQAGTDLPYTFNIRKDLFEKGDRTEFSLMLKFEEFNRPSPDAYELFMDTIESGSIYPLEINSKMLPFRRDRNITYASYFYGEGFFSSRRYFTLDGKGFQDEYVADHYGVVPLNEMQFTPTYYSPYSERLTMSSGELQIFNYIEDFNIGEVKVDKVRMREYRSIPLELVNKDGYSYLRTKNPYYISRDLRYQTEENHKYDQNWYETKQVFLPPVKGFETRNYNFQIVMNGTGECGIDRFIHNFKVIRFANAYGAKYNSDFFVREITDV